MKDTEFTDRKGVTWSVVVTVGDLQPLRDTAGFDVTELGATLESAGKVFVNHEMVVRSLYLLCREQIEAAGLDPPQFGRLFDGLTLVAARKALLAAILDFFQPPAEVRVSLLEALTGSPLNGSSKSAGKRRGSSASTRGRSRSGN